MDMKDAQEILRQLEEDRETVLKFIELQRRLQASAEGGQGLSPIYSIDKPFLVFKENKLKTGLKDAIIKFLDTHDGYHDRNVIANGILNLFPDETIETLLPKVSNALTKDRGIDNPDFTYQKKGEKKKIWALKRKENEL